MKESSTKNRNNNQRDEGPLPPLIFPAKSSTDKAWLKSLKDEGRVREIGPRLYTSVSEDQTEAVVRSGWSEIVAELYPGTVLSHRSALEYRPDSTNTIYLTGGTNRLVEFPGLNFEFVRGPGATEDDPVFRNFRVSSLARAILENLSVTKKTEHRGFTQEEMEKRLEEELSAKGEDHLNRLRDRARELAEDFEWQRGFKKLDGLIGGLLGTREAKLKTERAQARSKGKPFDIACNARLEVLAAELRAKPMAEIKDNYQATDHFRNKAFFEAYFSNYIEGTKFLIEEAEEIVFDKKIPERRPQDAHDILGTFELVSDPNEIRRCPDSLDQFLEIIRARHQVLMRERPDVLPGEFKERPNRAGNTYFVDPQFIDGTFEKGFEKYLELPKGLPRAIYMMFFVAEVHPFNDGNGRVARMMMNAELQAENLVSIIIPTVYREDYLTALRAMSHRERTDPLIRMLQRAQSFSNMEFSPYRDTLNDLERRKWFLEPSEGKIVEGE